MIFCICRRWRLLKPIKYIQRKEKKVLAKPSKQVKINPDGKIALIRNEDKAEQIITSKTGRMTWKENCLKGSWISQ